ncbi:sulfatase [Mycolicibacterium sp. CBMA 295]|uniref:sulfatase n=1 Tax=Mycolicibacterium sp. CBMA 295 TaxID=2606605 RepID=UPI0012DCE885|nr:sulfatase [Mycolicibacterium sp. CBMA 295]MUM29285.1 sulfatase [Mycolicibacterium sp. CBMA 295]
MKAIMVMFDSLNRRMLPPYGADWTHAPNFTRLAKQSVTFDNAWAGSLPCMPARREIHTGRYNFLHRSWGPLEPFDDSMPELLKQHGIHTHLASDHPHYWEDGGATYHGRYSTWEFFRGQEADPWKGQIAAPPMPDADLKALKFANYQQDWVNRQHLDAEERHPQTLTFDAGLEFIHTNAASDRWFVQIETFDPHEPFFSHKNYKDLYPHDYDGPHFDWPDYKRVTETPDQVEHARYEYAALLSMCDHSLGRVLDTMDELDLWDDTMLIVNTDHGFLLGEKGWWAKAVQPWYNELVHLPLFVWDPRAAITDQRRQALVQTIDLAPTLLDYFDVEPPADMQGAPLPIADDVPVRTAGLFGMHGGHVNVTDGRYVYMRAPVDPENLPLQEHTLMPTHMRGRFTPDELRDLELAEPFGFTKGIRTLRMNGRSLINPYVHGTLLFDLDSDPEQLHPIIDDHAEKRMATMLVELMRANEAPTSQYQRVGLPVTGPIEDKHLLVRAQHEQACRAAEPLPGLEEFPTSRLSVRSALHTLLAEPAAAEVVRRHIPYIANSEILQLLGPVSLYDFAAMAAGVATAQTLHDIVDDLVLIRNSE